MPFGYGGVDIDRFLVEDGVHDLTNITRVSTYAHAAIDALKVWLEPIADMARSLTQLSPQDSQHFTRLIHITYVLVTMRCF